MTETNPFRKFYEAGYTRLVPVVPHTAQVSEKSTLAKRPNALGKAVGIRGNDGLWRGYDWLKAPAPNLDQLDAWFAMGAGTGIRTGDGLVAVDIDTTNPLLAERAHELAVATLGPAPVRVGRAPKRLLVYRVTDPTPYQRVIFDDGLQHNPGAEARVELLSDDRQFVAWGVHPGTGKPYEWPHGAKRYDDLTLVTPEQVRAYFADLAAVLPAAKREQQTLPSDRNVEQAQLKGRLEDVRKAVAALPNTTALFPTYDDYVRVGYAIKGACIDDPAEGLALFQDWAAKWDGGNDPEVVEQDWTRMRPPFEIGAQYLYDLAERHGGGQFQRAEAWFEPVPDKPANPFDEAAEAAEDADRLQPIKWLKPSDWQGVEPPQREWEVEGWIPRREVTLLYGDGGIGKTLLIHQYATAAAAGVDWLGQKTRQARIMCFFCEDGEDELHRRQVDVCAALGVTLEQASPNLRIASRKYMDNLLAIWNRNTTAMQRTAVWEQLLHDAMAFGAEVVVVDTLADTFGGSEIDRSQVNSFVKSCLGRLAQAIDGSVVALGHPSVAGKTEGRSGSTAWSNASRSRIFLRYPKGIEKGDVRELEGMKLNYGPKGSLLKLKWVRGAFSVLASSLAGIDLNAFKGDGESASVPTIENANERAVLAALVEAEAAGIALNLSARSAAYAPKVLKRMWPEHLGDVSGEDVESAMTALEKRGLIRVGVVGRRANRMPIEGYTVDKAVLGEGAIDGGTADKMSDRDGVFA